MFDLLKAVPLTKDWTKTNENLDMTVEALKASYPQMFLKPDDLRYRKFFHEPSSHVPLVSYVVPAPNKLLLK